MIEIPFPKSVLNMTLTPSQGKYSFDPVNKNLTWDVGKIEPAKLPNIRGSVSHLLFYVMHEHFNIHKRKLSILK